MKAYRIYLDSRLHSWYEDKNTADEEYRKMTYKYPYCNITMDYGEVQI